MIFLLADCYRFAKSGTLGICSHSVGCDCVAPRGGRAASGIVEIANKRTLYSSPRHPYPQALLSAIPKPDPHAQSERVLLAGDVLSALSPPSGCRFHSRCLYVQERCRSEVPELRDAGPGHRVACHFHDSLSAMTPTHSVNAKNTVAARLAAYAAAKERSGTRLG